MNTAIQSPIINAGNTGSTAVQSNATDMPFIHHTFLTSLNLAVNAEFRFLVCQLCKEGIPTSTARGHIVNKHPELLLAFCQDQLDNVERKLQLAPSLPDTILGPRSIVHGLSICDAFACNKCPMVLTKYYKMKVHHQHCHHNIPLPQRWRACKAQRMKAKGAGKQRTLWEVVIIPDSALDPKEIMMTKLMEELDKELKVVQVPSDHRLISPWLLTTRWHEHIATTNMSIDELRKMIALPQSHAEEPFCKNLQQLVDIYFQEAIQLMDTTDELVLQRLISPDPVKQYV